MDGSGIIGNYLIEHELGRGGMGVVYAARHRVLARRAAIKLLLADTTSRPDRVERFFNEARAAMAIQHPGIVQVYDVGIAMDGRAYIAMEMLAGRTLTAVLERGPLPLRVALGYSRQIAEALAAAHAAGVIHRDLKPDNIFVVDGEQRVKLVDFGIAKLAQPINVRTATGALLGTPLYMSPEQCEAVRELDARSDLYALGCVMFAMLTGGPPFIDHVIAAHLHTAPPPLRTRCPSASPQLEAIVATLLAKSRDDRFRDARALLAALSQPGVDAITGANNAAMTADAPAVVTGIPTATAAPTPPAPHHTATVEPRAPMQGPGSMPGAYAIPPQPPPPPSTLQVPQSIQAYVPPPAGAVRRRGLWWALLGLAITLAITGLALRSCLTARTVTVVDAPRVVEVDATSADDGSDAREVTSTTAHLPGDAGLDVRALLDAFPPADAPSRRPDAGGRPHADARTVEAPVDAPAPPPPDAAEQPAPIDAAPRPAPSNFEVEIVFARDSFSVGSSSGAVIEQIVATARENPELRLLVIAEAGDDETRNPQGLATARANAVVTRLRLSRDRVEVEARVAPAGTSRRSVRIRSR